MKNNTKIKHVLIRFDLHLTMKDETEIEIILTDKWDHSQTAFSGKSLTTLIENAHHYLMAKTRESERG